MTDLSHVETDRLIACEAVIEQGLVVFVDVGRALTEIRDSKLYRAVHKTFEAYCKDRWEIGRSRAYELIDQAKVTEVLLGAGVNLSGAPDISGRDARALKDDPSAAKAVKDRVDAGEKPADAIKAVATERKAEKAEQQAEFDRQRDETTALLTPEVQEQRARAAEYSAKAKAHPAGDSAEAILAELEEKNEHIASLEAEAVDLKRTVAKFDDMVVEYERGGFENVIAGLEQRIDVLRRQVERESQEKVKNLRAADYWKKKALEAGANDDVVIDMATGEMSRG